MCVCVCVCVHACVYMCVCVDEYVHASMNTVYSLITVQCHSDSLLQFNVMIIHIIQFVCLCVHTSISIYGTEQYQMLHDSKHGPWVRPSRIKMAIYLFS